MIKLGQKGKDKVTGFIGIIVARSSWFTGCDQYLLSPKAKKSDEIKDAQWFDEGRIEIVGRGILPKEVKTKKNGGPQMHQPKGY